MTDLDLPAGFNDSPDPVKYDVLCGKRSEDLVGAIRDELGRSGAHSQQLTKGDKAAILLALRGDD